MLALLPAAFVGNWCLALDHIVAASDTFPYRRCKASQSADLMMFVDGYETYGASCVLRRLALRTDNVWAAGYQCKGDGLGWDSDEELRLTRYGFSSRFRHTSIRHGAKRGNYYLLDE